MLPSPVRALEGGRFRKENSPDALHLAVLTGRTKRIKHLLRKGVHIESVNTIGQTPLFCAAIGGDHEVVDLLLRLGANPNRRCGSNGAAPIHAAAYRGSRRVLRLLVEAGGDLSLRDSDLLNPRDYVEKQPSPLRRQKILQFFDLLYAMTLHRASTATLPSSGGLVPAGGSGGLLSDGGSNAATLRSQKLKGFFGSQLSLARKHSQSTMSVWSSCVSVVPSHSSDELDSSKSKEIVLTDNLHKNVSCHLLDQLCVTTSLPLLSPDQLLRPQTYTPAYTCGGPTVYSPFTWLGTPVTVRRPTPALSLNKHGNVTGGHDGAPDPEAVRSLLQELSFLRCLRHPGFLEVMAACHVTHPSPDHVTLVYQHVPYGSLYHHLHVQHRDLSVGSAVDILIGLVEALLFMHAHGWFHCGLSSHSLHLVGLGVSKLGGFEYALEAKVKGVGMRAEHVSKATWLIPWQSPETIVEKMVSVRSEIYTVATIIWEIWSGMPPWAGVEEEEVGKRVGNGESLPLLRGNPLSLVSYLTQYGLKWKAHERELDLQEVYTMLRSLRIQCNDDERVPAVTSWGPPSIPNTPVIGRHTSDHEVSSPLSSRSSFGELRLGGPGYLSLTKGGQNGTKWGATHDYLSHNQRRKSLETGGNQRSSSFTTKAIDESINLSSGEENFKSSFERVHERVRRQFSLMAKREEELTSNKPEKNDSLTGTEKKQLRCEGSGDSGFSTPCSRTPSPTYDSSITSRVPSILTSTPAKSTSTSGLSKFEKQPDLLPSKMTLSSFKALQMATVSPDVVTSRNNQCKEEQEKSENDFTYVTNAAKRAFLQSGEDGLSYGGRDRRLSDADVAVSNLLLEKRRQVDIVKRGLSMTNLCAASSGNISSIFTRTTSHISLCSTSSASSGENVSRKPVRTISQITLTLKKLSTSSSSASFQSKEDFNEVTPKSKEVDSERRKNTLSQPPYKFDLKSPPVQPRREQKVVRNYNEIVGIKPASHQLTRHSSSCSLASGPPSPAHQRTVTAYATLAAFRQNRFSSSNGSLPTSPTHSKYATLPPPKRPLSVFNGKESLLQDALGHTPLKIAAARRHSEATRHRARKSRRKQEVEVEEEFIDDEFNSLLYAQPHMQLSIGSSENLLDSRLSFSVLNDSASSNASQHSRQLTSSDDDDDNLTRRTTFGGIRPPLKALEETGDSDNVDNDDEDVVDNKLKLTTCGSTIITSLKTENIFDPPRQSDPSTGYSAEFGAKPTRVPTSDSDSDDVFSKGNCNATRGGCDKIRDYEPLKSLQLIKSLERNLTSYLPTYSIGSDSD